MSKSADTASAKSARLPELRLEHLVREATRLFQEFGYRNVSMEQIGATVGLTGPALYRHFPSKQDILAQALTAQVRTVSRFMADAQERGGTPEEQIGLFFDALGDMTAHRDVSILWNRERLHLERSGLSELNRSFGGLVDTLAAKISAARPAVDPAGAELLATAVLSVYSSTARMRGSLSAKRLMQVQRALTDSILDCDLATAPVVVGTDDARSRRSPIARRERILDVATELFFVRGFRNVRIDEIAAHAGVSVATVYHEHAGKTEILWTVIRRGIEGLLGTSIAALDGAAAGDTLDVLLRVFVDYSLGPNGRVLAVAVRDAVYLPEADQISLGRITSDYSAEWTTAIRVRTPSLSQADAKALEQALAGFAGHVISSPELRSRPGIDGQLRKMAYAILSPAGLGGASPPRPRPPTDTSAAATPELPKGPW